MELGDYFNEGINPFVKTINNLLFITYMITQ